MTVPDPHTGREYIIEILVAVTAPNYDAANRMSEDAKRAVEQTNFRIRDGRVDNVIVSEIRSDDD